MIQRTHQVMSEFRDEDKYVGLTKRQLMWAIPAVALLVLVTKAFIGLHLIEVAMFLDILIIGFSAVMMFVKIPADRWYLIGGGLFLQTIIKRVIFRRAPSNRVIYTKLY